jgi:hypothetical protein
MDNTTQKYSLVRPYALDPRIKKSKTTQANAIYTAIFAPKNSYLRHVTFVFCADVICYGFVDPVIRKNPFSPLPH